MPESNRAHSRILLSAYDEEAVRGLVEECRERVGGKVSLAFAFVSSDWAPHLDDFLEVVQVHGHVPRIVGSSCDGFIGTGEENENVSGCALLFLHLPDTEISFASFGAREVENAKGGDYWPSVTGVEAEGMAGWIVLSNPLTLDTETWLKTWNAGYPGVPCFGGLASGGRSEAEVFILREDGIKETGALAVGFRGGVVLQGVISQGCRPIGSPYTITAVNENVLFGIGSRKAYDVLEETFDMLEDEEKEIAQGNILAGLAMDEYREEFQSGDFLVRSILGGDPDAGALAIGAYPRVGQTLQFQMRDRDAADAELRALCEARQRESGEPFASLLFTCTGRGHRMFSEPNHDAGVVEEVFGRVPLAGFFCNGEVGPVGTTNFVHGYTASLALFLNA